jgi:hypothetical protein
MLVLKYFVVMGAVLCGLLLCVSAVVPPPDYPIFVSKFDSDRFDWRAEEGLPSPPVRRPPPPPHIAKVPAAEANMTTAVAAANPAPVAAAAAEPVPIEIAAAKPKKKRVRHRHARPIQDPDPWNAFAYAPQRGSHGADPWFR